MLWGLPEPPPAYEGAVALWQQFLPDVASEGMYSLPQEVHHDRDRLRASYLAWLHEVGQRPRGGRSLRDRMQIRPGLSYWWMTIPADFSLEPDSPAYRAVRLMAFATLADRLEARTIAITTRDQSLARAVTDWATATGRTVTSARDAGSEHASHDRRAGGFRQALYRAVPPVAAARVLASMLRAPKHGGRRVGRGGSGGITFIDYLAHLGTSARLDGEFQSNYWGPLVPLVAQLDEAISWLHISGEFATPAVVRADEEVVAAFNDSRSSQVHDLLHSHLSWGVVARSCLDYARIVGLGLRAGNRRRLFSDPSTELSLWPVYQESYRDQFYGRTAMLNVFWINLLGAAVSALPHQRLGVYLFENQPWEMALQHAWRQAGHGELIGVAHTTALFWSTRLFKDPRDMWTAEGEAPMPWPDRLAVNGPAMRLVCATAGYPPARMVDAEALRYFSLLGGRQAPKPRSSVHVLLLGEYSPDADRHLLEVLGTALDNIDLSLDVAVRPHPASGRPQTPEMSRMRVVEEMPLAQALDETDIVICGSLSSVAVETALMGVPTLLIGDPDVFTTSPAGGMPGVSFVLTPDELAEALAARGRESRSRPHGDDVLLLDPEVPRWRRLLGLRDQQPPPT
jgi:surface carbohydrate biosynthesis protein (TIGR04326 family)